MQHFYQMQQFIQHLYQVQQLMQHFSQMQQFIKCKQEINFDSHKFALSVSAQISSPKYVLSQPNQ